MAVRNTREQHFKEKREMWGQLFAPAQRKALELRTARVKEMRSVELLEQLQAIKVGVYC